MGTRHHHSKKYIRASSHYALHAEYTKHFLYTSTFDRVEHSDELQQKLLVAAANNQVEVVVVVGRG